MNKYSSLFKYSIFNSSYELPTLMSIKCKKSGKIIEIVDRKQYLFPEELVSNE